MSRAALLALLALVLALSACGDDGGGERGAGGGGATGATDTTGPGATDENPVTAVEVVLYVPELGGGARRYKVFCNPPDGTHPRPERACETLLANRDALEPVPDDVACTQEFGGPRRAVIHGLVEGEEVEAELSRTNGCEIARWDRLAPILNIG